jgi:hypothetical protein
MEMSQLTYRANINSAQFPFLSDMIGRTVIIPNQDQVYNRNATADSSQEEAANIPQMYYCHNVIPTAQGVMSVAYSQLATAPADTDNLFASVNVIRDSSGNKAYLGTTSSGRCYILTTYLSGWVRTTDVTMAAGKQLVTTAYVNGVTYIYFQEVGCYVYNFATNTLTPTTLTSLTANQITGITTSSGYLLAYGVNGVAWSSQTSTTDFTPSLISGAGGGNVQDVKGTIVICVPQKFGFVVYSSYNVVVAVYTGNPRYPFNYREIIDSGGLPAPELVSYDPVTSEQYAWTTAGIQLVAAQQTQTVFPELTDFIAGGYFEDFDEGSLTFSHTYLTSPMAKKFTVIADRYFLFSYGISSLTHCILYDTILKRWGKLKIPHVDCFEYLLTNTDQVDTARKSIGFLQSDGTVQVVVFGMNAPYASGVALFGRYQIARPNVSHIQEIIIDGIRMDAIFTCYDMACADGMNYSQITAGTLKLLGNLTRTYSFRYPALNHSILLKGQFNLTSLVLKFVQGGYR